MVKDSGSLYAVSCRQEAFPMLGGKKGYPSENTVEYGKGFRKSIRGKYGVSYVRELGCVEETEIVPRGTYVGRIEKIIQEVT